MRKTVIIASIATVVIVLLLVAWRLYSAYCMIKDLNFPTAGSPSLGYQIAMMQMEACKIERARASFRQIIEKHPKSIYATRARAQLDTAIPLVTINQDLADEYRQALTLTREGNYKEAEKRFNECAAKCPGFMWPRCNVAAIQTGQRRFDEAEKGLTELVAEYPKYARAYIRLSCLEYARKNFEKSKEYYKKARELNPYDPCLHECENTMHK